MSITIKKEALEGAVAWDTVATGVTAYRTDLARGITAAQVPYSGVSATNTFTSDVSAVPHSWNVLAPTVVAE